jgi:type II secretory pathway pseudopilin PulG
MERKYSKASRKDIVLNLKRGMTLSEALVVVAILALLLIVTMSMVRPNFHIGRSRDKRRIADLKKISISLEDYAGDHDCYPESIYATDGSRATDEFGYYLRNIPRDPLTEKPYQYVLLDTCKQYAIYADLEYESEENYVDGKYYITSDNVRGVPTIIAKPPPGDSGSDPLPPSTPGSSSKAYGCFKGECRMLSEDEKCEPRYIRLDDCVGKECCTFSVGGYTCDYVECTDQ